MALSSNALCAKAKAMYGYRIGEEGIVIYAGNSHLVRW